MTEDFKELSNFEFGNVGSNQIKVHHNMISKDDIIKNDLLNNEFVLKIHKKYHKRVFRLLVELNPQKAELYDYTDLKFLLKLDQNTNIQYMMILQINY